jgi:hypothetical protein
VTQQHRFLVALDRLRDWYAPSTKAQTFDGPQTTGKPEHRMLRSQSYPDESNALYGWRRCRSDEERERAIAELEAEFAELLRAPRREQVPTFHGRLEWRRRVAAAPGSVRVVAERYGISKSTVSRYRSAAS